MGINVEQVQNQFYSRIGEPSKIKFKRPRCLLNPVQDIKWYWDILVVFLCIYSCIFTPVHISFHPEWASTVLFKSSEFLVTVCLMADILITMNTSYFELEGSEVCIRSKILKKYVFSPTFIINVFQAVPWHDFDSAGYLSFLTATRVLRV